MKRTAVNPWDWSIKVGYNQGEIIEGVSRQFVCAGQTAVDQNGIPQHQGDIRAQIDLALDNLEAVLAAANMDLSNIIKLGVFSTDVDEALKNFDLMGSRFAAYQVSPPMTVLEIKRLALPGLLFEIEATAAA